MNYPPYDTNDPYGSNDPHNFHSQPTMAEQYPQWSQSGQSSYPQWEQQVPPPPPPPQFPQQPGQYSQSGQNFPPDPPQYPQLVPDKLPFFDVKAIKEYFKRHPEAQKKQFLIGCGTLIGIFLLCAVCSAIGNISQFPQQPAPVRVSSPAQTASDMPTVVPLPDTPTPTLPPMPHQKRHKH